MKIVISETDRKAKMHLARQTLEINYVFSFMVVYSLHVPQWGHIMECTLSKETSISYISWDCYNVTASGIKVLGFLLLGTSLLLHLGVYQNECFCVCSQKASQP